MMSRMEKGERESGDERVEGMNSITLGRVMQMESLKRWKPPDQTSQTHPLYSSGVGEGNIGGYCLSPAPSLPIDSINDLPPRPPSRR